MKIIALSKGIALKEYFIEGMDNSGIHLANAPFEFKKCEYWKFEQCPLLRFPQLVYFHFGLIKCILYKWGAQVRFI